jgi:hypothetical protein
MSRVQATLAPSDFAHVLQVVDVIDLCEKRGRQALPRWITVPCDAGAEPVGTGMVAILARRIAAFLLSRAR